MALVTWVGSGYPELQDKLKLANTPEEQVALAEECMELSINSDGVSKDVYSCIAKAIRRNQ
jgi:hypothetical protein